MEGSFNLETVSLSSSSSKLHLGKSLGKIKHPSGLMAQFKAAGIVVAGDPLHDLVLELRDDSYRDSKPFFGLSDLKQLRNMSGSSLQTTHREGMLGSAAIKGGTLYSPHFNSALEKQMLWHHQILFSSLFPTDLSFQCLSLSMMDIACTQKPFVRSLL